MLKRSLVVVSRMPHLLISSTRCLAEPGADLDPGRACLAPDLGPPGLDVAHLIDRVDHRAARQQLAVVVAAVDTRDDAVDASWMPTGSCMNAGDHYARSRLRVPNPLAEASEKVDRARVVPRDSACRRCAPCHRSELQSALSSPQEAIERRAQLATLDPSARHNWAIQATTGPTTFFIDRGWVDGSSPSEGSAKAPEIGMFAFRSLAPKRTCRGYGAVYGAVAIAGRIRQATARRQRSDLRKATGRAEDGEPHVAASSSKAAIPEIGSTAAP